MKRLIRPAILTLTIIIFISVSTTNSFTYHKKISKSYKTSYTIKIAAQNDEIIVEPEVSPAPKKESVFIKLFSPAGHIAGIAGFILLCLTMFAGSSARLLDKYKILSLADALRMHKKLSLLSYCVILIHPLSFFIVYKLRKIPVNDLFRPNINALSYAMGAIAFYIFTAVIISSLFFIKSNHKVWLFIHRLSAVALCFATYHMLKEGTWIYKYKILLSLVILSLALAVSGIIMRIYIAVKKKKRQVSVTQLRQETSDTYTLICQKPDGFVFKAGQFCFISFKKKYLTKPHPFTISSSPEDNVLEFTIKESGKFTSRIKTIKEGETLILDGPYGLFTLENKNPVFIAGGVGITPFKSMSGSSEIKKSTDPILIYGNKTESDIIFNNFFSKENIAKHLKVYHVLSSQTKSGYDEGIINDKILNKYVDFENRDFYICGPPMMIKGIIKTLKKHGVRKKNIHYEKFFY
jgi:predicted ferric reductase